MDSDVPSPEDNNTSPPADDAADAEARPASALELALVFGASLVLTRVLSDLAGVSAWVNTHLFTLVSAVFLLLPYAALWRRRADFDAHALTGQGWPRALALALALTVLTALPFFAGYHVWQTQVNGRTFAFDWDHYRHLEATLEGRPDLGRVSKKPEVLLWSDGPVVHLRWSTGPHDGRAPAALRVELGAPGGEVALATGRAHAVDPEVRRRGAPAERVVLASGSHKPRYASFRMSDAQALEVRVLINGAPATQTALKLGPSRAAPDAVGRLDPASGRLTLGRGWDWLPMLLLAQLLLVALPEEVFYRGYLQTALDQRNPKRWRLPLGLHLSPAIVLTSVAFGVGHFVINLHPARLAVFFPSLLFGWLRDRTGTLASCIVYHAACNMLVELAAQHYV